MRQSAIERVPIEPGYFTIPADAAEAPHLLGSRCQSCGEHFFPRRPVCARCRHRGTDDVELSPRGTLYTHTYIYVPLFNSNRATDGGYGVGQIDLPEGPRILAELAVLPEDMTTRQWVAHAGPDPRDYESGSSVRAATRISKVGNRHLRAALFMPAMVAARYEPRVHAYYEKLIERGKKPLQAIVAVMRKLLHAINGMFRHDAIIVGEKFCA
jgi:uncharacterized OB-fold protein